MALRAILVLVFPKEATQGGGWTKYDQEETVENINCSDGLVTAQVDDAEGGHHILRANLLIATDGSAPKTPF